MESDQRGHRGRWRWYEQFTRQRRLEEKEAVLTARPGSQLQGLVQTGRLVCGEGKPGWEHRGEGAGVQHTEAAFPGVAALAQ